jgi:hypothetical protein
MSDKYYALCAEYAEGLASYRVLLETSDPFDVKPPLLIEVDGKTYERWQFNVTVDRDNCIKYVEVEDEAWVASKDRVERINS